VYVATPFFELQIRKAKKKTPGLQNHLFVYIRKVQWFRNRNMYMGIMKIWTSEERIKVVVE